MKDFGATLAGFDKEFFATQQKTWYKMERPPFRVGVLQSIEGKDFDDAWPSSLVGERFGVPIYVVVKSDLTENKLAAGRPQDLQDAKNLQRE